MKSAVVAREDVAVLEECERHLGASLAIVQTQYDHIVSSRTVVQKLREKMGGSIGAV